MGEHSSSVSVCAHHLRCAWNQRLSAAGLPWTVSHTHRTWCRLDETKLCVEVLRLTIRDQAYVAAFRNMGVDVFHDFNHDSFP